MNAMDCQHCGAKLPDGAKFCPGCGTAVNSGQKAAGPTPAETAAPNEGKKRRPEHSKGRSKHEKRSLSPSKKKRLCLVGGIVVGILVVLGIVYAFLSYRTVASLPDPEVFFGKSGSHTQNSYQYRIQFEFEEDPLPAVQAYVELLDSSQYPFRLSSTSDWDNLEYEFSYTGGKLRLSNAPWDCKIIDYGNDYYGSRDTYVVAVILYSYHNFNRIPAEVYDWSAGLVPDAPEEGAAGESGIQEVTYSNGSRYQGEMKDGKRHGTGTMTYADGNANHLDYYTGEWKDDQRSGIGMLVWKGGDVYEGEWKDDQVHGAGTYTFSSGMTLVGTWVNGKEEGEFLRTMTDGSVYKQIYRNGEQISSELVSNGSGGSTSTPSGSQPAAPDSAILPDLGLFLNCGRGEDMPYGEDGHLVSYSFDLDEGKAAVAEVIQLLQEEQYQLTLSDTREDDYISSSALLVQGYDFSYTGTNGAVGLLSDWQDHTFDVQIGVNYYYDQGRIGLTMYYSNGFTLEDPGTQASNPPTDFSGNPVSGSSGGSSGSSGPNIPEFAQKDCSICHGTGDCQTCGGDGYLWSSASGKEDRNCWRCPGHNGRCWACNGTGKA